MDTWSNGLSRSFNYTRMKLNIELEGLENVKNNMGRRADKVKAVIHTIFEKSLFIIERYSKIESPVRTGRLRASISEGKFLFNKYAQIGPTVFYAKYVHARNPFMDRGVAKSLPDIKKMVEEEIKQAVK